MKIESGILDSSKLISNILLLVLVAGNIFFSIQYIQNLKDQAAQEQQQNSASVLKVQTAHFLNFFINTVLNSSGTVSPDDRVKLEADVHALGNAAIIAQWNAFVGSKDAVTAQTNAVKLMSMLTATML